MFTNTGTLSFYLGISFIVVALVGFVLTCFLVLRSTIDQSKLEKLIDVGKWFIVSVAIVVGASIVSDAFKEREQDVKEFEVFDRYVATVIKADNIEQRLELAKYFSTVAPKGQFHDSWLAYQDVVRKDHEQYLADKKTKQDLDQKVEQKQPLTVDEQKTRIEATANVSRQERPIVSAVPVQSASADDWGIVAASDATLAAAGDELRKAIKISPSARIYKKGSLFQTVIPGFRGRPEAESSQQLRDVKASVRSDAIVLPMSAICPAFRDNGDFIQCS